MKEDTVHFYTLNVGHGDSHVIHFPKQEAAVIIDPGNGRLINRLISDHISVKYIPLIIVSHGDMDHMGGLNEIITEWKEKRKGIIELGPIYFNDEGTTKIKDKPRIRKFFIKFSKLIRKHSLKYKYIVARDEDSGSLSKIFAQYGLDCKMFYPEHVDILDSHLKGDYNLGSLLFCLSFAKKKILFTGDLPYRGWKQVPAEEDLKSDVFKVPHHGGRISHSPGADMKKILERVKPNFALISAGDKYNHPRDDVVKAIVTHHSKPHLFCTRMTKQCSLDKNIKTKIEKFYEKGLRTRIDKEIIKLGSHEGVLCAGTIRVTFDASRHEDQSLTIVPSQVDHVTMLRTLFNPLDHLLCYPGI